MSYEIKTPLLQTTALKLLGAMSAVEAKTMTIDQGHFIVRACNGVRGAIETDLKVSLAQPKLAKLEADATGTARSSPTAVAA